MGKETRYYIALVDILAQIGISLVWPVVAYLFFNTHSIWRATLLDCYLNGGGYLFLYQSFSALVVTATHGTWRKNYLQAIFVVLLLTWSGPALFGGAFRVLYWLLVLAMVALPIGYFVYSVKDYLSLWREVRDMRRPPPFMEDILDADDI